MTDLLWIFSSLGWRDVIDILLVAVAVFLLLSIVGAYLLPMTRKRHEALKLAIQQKKEGRQWDEASLKAIL